LAVLVFKDQFAPCKNRASVINEQLFLSQGLKNFVNEAFDCIAQSSSAIKVSSRHMATELTLIADEDCHTVESFVLQHFSDLVTRKIVQLFIHQG